MRRYIDEKTGKIVNILDKEEANKIVKILIDYFFVEGSVPAGRLNLVAYLKDYIRLGNIEDLKEIADYITEYKKEIKISKEDEEDFETLHQFFRVYKDLEESKITIEDISNYISEMTDKKEELFNKEQKDMSKKDKILNFVLDKDMDFKVLAKIACDAWENNLKEKMNSTKKEVHVSLEEEIAYQDLLEFAAGADVEIAKKTVNKKEEKMSKMAINIQMPDKKEEPVTSKVEIEVKETKKEELPKEEKETVESVEKEEEKIHTIEINHVLEDDVPEKSSKDDDETEVEVQPFHREEAKETKTSPHQITQHDINELLGLDEDLGNNSNFPIFSKKPDTKNVESVEKEEKVHTIEINHLVEDDVPQKPERTDEEKRRREEGYTSNIQIFVPGVDDKKEENNINPEDVKKATENVDLKESVEFFSDVLDDMSSKKEESNEDSDGDFRD